MYYQEVIQRQLGNKLDASKADSLKEELQASVKQEVKEETGKFQMPESSSTITRCIA
jgi:hypothetical protein